MVEVTNRFGWQHTISELENLEISLQLTLKNPISDFSSLEPTEI